MQIDFGLILTFVGIILAIFGIYTTLRNYKGEISFVQEENISLFDSIVKNLPELSIKFNAEPVTPNLNLLKGALLNSGKKDISKLMVEEPIRITLDKGFKWLAAKVVVESKGLEVNTKIVDPNVLEFSIGLMRCQEYFRFQAVLSKPPVKIADRKEIKNIKKNNPIYPLKFSHRIQDIKNIKKIEITNPKLFFNRAKKFIVLGVITILMGITILIFPTLLTIEQQRFVFEDFNDKSKVYIKNIMDNKISVVDINSSLNKDIPFDIFVTQYKLAGKLKNIPYADTLYYPALALYFLLPFIGFALMFFIYRRDKKIYNILHLNE